MGKAYLCAGYKAFFTHIAPTMKTMAGLLRQGRFADEIMQLTKYKWDRSREKT